MNITKNKTILIITFTIITILHYFILRGLLLFNGAYYMWKFDDPTIKITPFAKIVYFITNSLMYILSFPGLLLTRTGIFPEIFVVILNSMLYGLLFTILFKKIFLKQKEHEEK